MSDFSRLKRITRSWLPSFSFRKEPLFSFDDTRQIINSLGLQMSPQTLDYLCFTDEVLDDFAEALQNAMRETGYKDLVTDDFSLNPDHEPMVTEKEGKVYFTIRWKKEAWIFAEYDLPAAPADKDWRK